MADNYLWDKESSPTPTSDVENPQIATNRNAPTESSTNNTGSSPFSTSKTVKLALGLIAVAGAVALGVVLGLNLNSPVIFDDASSASSFGRPVAESNIEAVKSVKQNPYMSSGPLEPQVKMVSSSIIDGYETCSDLEKDITDALKLYFNDYINIEADSNEMYASCDPDNENWYWEYYGYDDDSYPDYYNADYQCEPTINSTFTCDVKDGEAPFVVVWHEWDHANGTLYYNKTEALQAYENVDNSFAKRLYYPYKMVVEQYGYLDGSDWCELETYAYEAQCTGETPTSTVPTKKMASKKSFISSVKQTRSDIPTQKQTRSRIPSEMTKRNQQGKSRSNRNSDAESNGYEQNSQNDNVNEQDKVVSDGNFIFAAYGDVLQAWRTNDSSKGVSITRMPGDVKECDWNTTEPCTSSSKPFIHAIFLGNRNSRLTVVTSQNIWEYGTFINYTQPIVSDGGSKLIVRVYDVSNVVLGLPLTELANKELAGSFLDGGSIGDSGKTVIATEKYIDSWTLTKDISRSHSLYCGLNKTSYISLATSTAEGLVESFAKQITNELKTVSDCSNILQVSKMQDASSEADFLVGQIVQMYTLDTASVDDGDIPAAVAGSFSPSYGYGYSLFLTEDFIAFPSNVVKYDYATGSSIYSTFIIGYGLSTDGDFVPSYYGHIPGEMRNNYRMDKKDNQLRILSSDYILDENGLATSYLNKIFVLDLPADKGHMSVLGESENLLHESYYATGSLFSGDTVYLCGDDYNYDKKKSFVVVDIPSGEFNPTAVGSLELDSSISYLQEIYINNALYIIGIGSETNDTTWESFVALVLIDVSTPSEPKLAAAHKVPSSSSTDVSIDIKYVRYFDGSLVIPITTSKYNENTYTSAYREEFFVYDISESSISPVFNVTHSVDEILCYYDASIPARSFVINSQLTTIDGHTVITTTMDGSFVSTIDLDEGFNYSVCDDWYYSYHNDSYSYYDEVEEETNDSI